MKIGGIKFKYAAAVIAILAIAAGIWITFFQSKGFEKTDATIVSIEEVESETADDEKDHIVMVEYDVDGTRYTQQLDSFSPSYKVGKTVSVRYDPNDPSVIHGGSGMGIYSLAIGALILAGVVFSSLRSKKALSELQEKQSETFYAPSVQGEERQLYFLTDRGTAKYGHRIEDQNRQVLYEAKVTKYNLAAPIEFEFIDHEHGRRATHLVGHQDDTEWDSLLIDNHSTFTFDGEDVWKHLKRNGIRVDAGFMEGKVLRPQYRVFRDEREIALVESSSVNVHEEDAEEKGKLGDFVPARGFYRIRTREENLDLLFVTVLSFARTAANDGAGGNYGLLFHKKPKD